MSDDPIRNRDDLLAVFHESATAGAVQQRIGPEMEKCGIHPADLSPVDYDGVITNVLVDLAANHGWKADRERDDGPLIALEKNGASVTLEPGGQLELSGAPGIDVHAIDRETRDHMRELADISNRLGVRWMGIGFHPFARRDDLHWVPKARYTTMREYFPKIGQYGIDMMLRTCTVQANLDYVSEADAMRKMRLSLAIAPLTTAMFANSPYVEGAPFGGVTMRGLVWTDVDAKRSGLVPGLWKKDARYDDYVAWALEAPMFILKRDGVAIPNTEQTFAQFLANGKDGHHATQADWRLHLNTLFPEVRLKRTIEIRGADAQGPGNVSALHALYAGLLYDTRSENELEAIVESWSFDEVNALRATVWHDGLRTKFRGSPLAEIASKIVAIAKGGLQRRARKDERGQDESVHLGALESLASHALTPADVLLEQIGTGPSAKQKLVELTDLASLA